MRKSLVLLGSLALIMPAAAFAQAPVQGTEPPSDYGTTNPESSDADMGTPIGSSRGKMHHHHVGAVPVGTASSSGNSTMQNSGFVTEPDVPAPLPATGFPGGGSGTNSAPH